MRRAWASAGVLTAAMVPERWRRQAATAQAGSPPATGYGAIAAKVVLESGKPAQRYGEAGRAIHAGQTVHILWDMSPCMICCS